MSRSAGFGTERFMSTLFFKAVFFVAALTVTLSCHAISPQQVTPEQREYRQSLGLTPQEISWLEQHPRLILGIDRNFQPYEWIDSEGRYQGIAADFLHLIGDKLGINFIPVSDKSSWGEVLAAARNGEFDLMSCLVKTPERSEFLNFTEPYMTSSAVIIGQQSRGYITGLEQLNGKTVAIHKGHYTRELLQRDFPEIRIVTTDNLAAALKLVANGGADAFVGDVTAASHKIRQLGIVNLGFSAQTGYQSEFRMGINPQHTELLTILQKTINSINEAEHNQIFDRWHTFGEEQGIPKEILIRYGVLAILLLIIFSYWNIRLRQSRQRALASEERFRNLVETTDGIVWEADVNTLQFTYVSDNAERLLGYTSEQWKTKDFWQNHIHPEDRDWAIQYCADETCLLRDHDFEYRFIDAWGQTIWLRDMVSVVAEEDKPRWLRGLMLDITEQKLAQQLVQQSEYRFRELIESLPTVAVQGYDEDRRVIYWNEASVQLYGYGKDEAIGRQLEELIIPEEMVPEVIQLHRDWLEHSRQIPAGEMLLRHKSGRSVPVFSNHVMLQSDNSHSEMYCIDISLEEQHRAHAELKQMAHFDPLTQLPNRLTFADRLDQAMRAVRRDGSKLALLLMDLDHFKEVNDTLGHDYGDLLLLEAAKRLKHCVRETDTVARLGGDEFLIILTGIPDLQAIERVARNVIQQMAEAFSLKEHRAFVSASIGITLFPDDADSMEVLLKNADQAMYAAKQSGRNRFHYFTPEMEQNAQQRRRIFNDLREAVKNDQLQLHYQPIVNLKTSEVKKAEALLRWQHPDRLIMPDEFIPIAEDAGFIYEIGNWVFQEVARQNQSWLDNHGQDIKVSVNTSPVQYRDEQCCRAGWFEQLKSWGLHGDNLCVEITESLLMEAGRSVSDKLMSFKEQGIEVSLDDFGTGYSSLAYLKHFDIDYLKIDRSFVSHLKPDSHDLVLCEAIIVMAHTLGIQVIAEGVETEEQRQLLMQIGCDYGQGYLFAKPLNAEDFARQWLLGESTESAVQERDL